MKKVLILSTACLLLIGCQQAGSEPAELIEKPKPITTHTAPPLGHADGMAPLDDDIVMPPEDGMIIHSPLDALIPVGVDLPWKYQGVSIEGNYADAEVVQIDDRTWRMYYSVQPEIEGNKLELYSATSTDGVNWTTEDGVRKEFSTFADVIRLDDGTWRMYFQNMQEIKSAISTDGLTWTDEEGSRLTRNESSELEGDNIASPSTMRLDDGTYVMVYRGEIEEKYREDVPHRATETLLWARSSDGLTFEKQGVAVSSDSDLYLGKLDGNEWVEWTDGTWRLYYWSYGGVYYVTFDGTAFSDPEVAEVVFTTLGEYAHEEMPVTPGDPSIANINGDWYMYFGQKDGIHYAKYE